MEGFNYMHNTWLAEKPAWKKMCHQQKGTVYLKKIEYNIDVSAKWILRYWIILRDNAQKNTQFR